MWSSGGEGRIKVGAQPAQPVDTCALHRPAWRLQPASAACREQLVRARLYQCCPMQAFTIDDSSRNSCRYTLDGGPLLGLLGRRVYAPHGAGKLSFWDVDRWAGRRKGSGFAGFAWKGSRVQTLASCAGLGCGQHGNLPQLGCWQADWCPQPAGSSPDRTAAPASLLPG